DVANTCADLDTIDAIDASGTFDVAMDGFSSTWNLIDTDCAGSGYSSSGTDAAIPVFLDEGDTLTATWSHSFCDGVLYLTEACDDIDTCLISSDGISGAETITYTNTTGLAHDFTLVLDQYGTSCTPSVANPGSLTITIDSGVPVGGDTCGDAEGLTPVGAGTH